MKTVLKLVLFVIKALLEEMLNNIIYTTVLPCSGGGGSVAKTRLCLLSTVTEKLIL